jgi:micrococcal nuclease
VTALPALRRPHPAAAGRAPAPLRPRRLPPLIVVAVAALALAGCGRLRVSAGPAAPPRPAVALPPGLDVLIERVVDGDTVVVTGGRRVRLIGVDTPETKDPRKPVQCFGKEAAAFLGSVLPPGTGVRLVGDVVQTDAYDRTLAYAYRLPDGLFVNAELVRQGYAHVLTIPPNVAHTAEFVELSRQAREEGKGLWQACGPAP